MTDREKIRAEIERLKSFICSDSFSSDFGKGFKLGRENAYGIILSFINSLPEEPVKDLNEAANNYVLNIRKGYPRVMDETDRYISNAFKDAAQWQKEQLMKDAKDVEILEGVRYGQRKWTPVIHLWGQDYDFKIGDKVKVIIVKED